MVPLRDSLWINFTPGDRAADARINDRLRHWCNDYELFRIDSMLLSDEEKAHCATLANPHNLKCERIGRLFPTEDGGGPFVKRLHLNRYAARAHVGGVWNFIAPLPSVEHGADPSTPSSTELGRMVQAVTFLKDKRIVPNYLPRAVLRAFKDRYKSIAGLSPSVLAELTEHICGD